MAEIITPNAGKGHKTVARQIKVDMTPLVDLAFLLITFFIFTTTISQPAALPLSTPKDGPPLKSAASNSLSFLLGGGNRIYAYEGIWEEAMKHNRLLTTSYDLSKGSGSLIRAMQSKLEASGKPRTDLVVLIKPGKEATLQNTVDMFDEMIINGVTRYALADPDAEEMAFLLKR